MKDFDAEARERHASEAALTDEDRQFRFGGEVLTRRRRVPAKAVIALGQAVKTNDEAAAALAVISGMDAMITTDSQDAFHRALDATDEDGEAVVDNDTLMDCYRWLLSETTRRPPTQPSVSSPPQPPNGTSSTGDSSAAAQTSPPSLSTVS